MVGTVAARRSFGVGGIESSLAPLLHAAEANGDRRAIRVRSVLGTLDRGARP